MCIYRVLLLFLFLFGGSGGFAQSFNSGVHLGFNASQVNGDNLAGYNKLGLNAGIFVEYGLKKEALLDLGIRFTQKGSRMGPNKREKTGQDYEIALSYLEVPVHYRFPIYSNLDLIFGLGLGVLVAQEEGDGGGPFPSFEPFNPVEVSARAGIGYSVSERSTIDVFITNSIIPIRAHASGATNRLNYGMLNNVVEFSFRRRFRMR